MAPACKNIWDTIVIAADQPTIFDEQKLVAAVSSAEDDNLSLARGPAEQVVPARERWLSRLELELNQLVVMDVTHPAAWDSITEVTAADRARGAENQPTAIPTDALVTSDPNLVLFLLTADCQPAIIYDPSNRAVALVHLGWQSVDAELAGKVVNFMQKRYGSEASDLQVYIGPAIKAGSYIQPVAKQADDPRWRPYVQKIQDGFRIDISAFTVAQLEAVDILRKNIEVCPVDTATNTNYFSHYRVVRSEGAEAEARFATIAMPKGVI
jgi:YfiH family protein